MPISPSSIFSQSYDGANVMSGKDGGVQKLLQNKLARRIPYIHDMNHALHLVVMKALSNVTLAKQLFDQVCFCCLHINYKI